MTIFGMKWRSTLPGADNGPPSTKDTSSTEDAARHSSYVLEVISLGVTYEKYRQGKLWEALEKGSAQTSIREPDPMKYPWSDDAKDGMEGGRANDAMENGGRMLPMYWGTPTFSADSSVLRDRATDLSPPTVGGDPTGSGMAFQLFIAAGWEMSERPDRLLQRIFDFFDKYPDVPYVVLSADEGMYFRNLYRPRGTPPLVKNGNYIPEIPTSSVFVVLARRERVDPLRPFSFADADEEKMLAPELNKKGFARRLYLDWLAKTESVPTRDGTPGRNLTTAEWLQLTSEFSKRQDIYPKTISLLHPFSGGPSSDFKPTPWFPIPWNKAQLEAFDRLPTLGFLHRPVFVPMVDKDGHALTRRDEREAALAAGWQQALQTLPESERKAAPARVIAATGGNIDQTMLLTSVLNQWTHQGGPELDANKPTQWINTDARLGNTGAATWFMQMAIGVMGSYQAGGASAAINMRDPNEASIVFVTPPSEQKRKTQYHAEGGDVWHNVVGPNVDPDNYQ